MPTIPSITLDPGAEFDFTTDETTIISGYTPFEWNGTVPDHTILNSEDNVTQASVTLPCDITVSYCNISNLAVTGPFKLYANNGTNVNGGNNNPNVVFSTDKILVSGVWKDIVTTYILIGGLWKTVADRNIKVTVWKS